jgi:hypothetical protein
MRLPLEWGAPGPILSSGSKPKPTASPTTHVLITTAIPARGRRFAYDDVPTRPGRIGGRRAGNVRNRFIHLGGQAFDVGLFYERFLVAGYMHPEMLHYLSYSPKRCGRFLLREQVDLKIQMGTAVSLTHHLILANQDPDGEKDCLERHDHREQTERLGVERLDERHPPAVDQDPAREPCEMRCCEHRGGGRSGERTR